MLKRSWLEIDLGVLRRNYEIYRSMTAPGVEIMAVVKADAYGQTAVAQMLHECGCRSFAVSNIEEAVRRRR